MTEKIHINLFVDKKMKTDYEKTFNMAKAEKQGLKKLHLFKAFVKKFIADPEATAKFINLDKEMKK